MLVRSCGAALQHHSLEGLAVAYSGVAWARHPPHCTTIDSDPRIAAPPTRIRTTRSGPSIQSAGGAAPKHPLLQQAQRTRTTECACPAAPFSTSCSRRSTAYSFPWHIPSPTPYDVLQLPRTATQPQIKARYYELAKELHPDRRLGPRVGSGSGSGGEKGKAREQDSEQTDAARDADEAKIAEEFRIVVLAYEVLSDGRKRRSYDRHGIGWDWGTNASSDGRGYGRYGAATRAEWEELMWRSRTSRGARGGRHRPPPFGSGFDPRHDATGWQRQASASWAFYDAAGPRGGSGFAYRADADGGPSSSAHRDGDSFQGDFYWSNTNHAHGTAHQGRYATNRRFIALVALVTWSLALFQFQRLSAQSTQSVELADRKHRDAAHQLELARRVARSTEGREKLEAMRAKAKEMKREQTFELMASGEMPTGHLGQELAGAERYGRGGADALRKRTQRSQDQQQGRVPSHDLPALPPPPAPPR